MNDGHGQRNGTTLCLLTNLASASNITQDTLSVVLPFIQRLPSVIFLQDNMRPHVSRNVQEFFTHQSELLPWPACSSDACTATDSETTLSATPDQL
ncbi:hypothetical protein TNCV_3437681 [Trichonephila clavipes]|nr:hypothetical protein TNCV_3437681 [Trichonephila clavipes]